MEHFAAPNGMEPIDVPYVGTEEYDGYDFLGYPQRKGWSQDDLMGNQGFGDRSPKEVEAFFQTWLYFGCLICVLGPAGVKVKTYNFIREMEKEKFITTKLLPDFIQDWMNREGMNDKEYQVLAPDHNPEMLNKLAKRDRGSIIESILRRVLFFVDRYCNEKAHDEAQKLCINFVFWPMSPKIAMSIMAIGKPLMHVAVEIYGYPRYQEPHWGSSPFLNERLVKAGWCIGEVPLFGENATIDCDYYFGAYPSPRKQLNHENCTKAGCRAKNIDVATYTTKHATSCSDPGCRMVLAPDKVVDIVKSRGIPMVSWQGNELKVAEYDKQSKSKYVAISHVWSDGMGNDDKNALPECQLARLQNLVDRLYTEKHESYRGTLDRAENQVGLFWIDTLCVPLHKEYRLDAIRMMKNIYQLSDRVLVLDSFIQEVPRSANITEKSVRLYLSNWHHRLWTLQEGLYAQSLFFQFKDGAQTIKDMHPEYAANHNSLIPFYSSVRANCAGQFDPFYEFVHMTGSVQSSFYTFSYFIRSRTTSKMEDEAICFSTLLGLDPAPLFKVEGEKRMESFYGLVKKFPRVIVFNDFPRLQSDGFRWAPKSFLGNLYNPFPVSPGLDETQATLLHGGGLCTKFPGIKLDVGIIGPHFETNFFFIPNTEPRFLFKIWLRPDIEGNYPIWDSGATYMILLGKPMIESVADKGAALESALDTLRMDLNISRVFRKKVAEDAATEAILGTFEGNRKSGRVKVRHVCRARVEVLHQKELTWLYLGGKTNFGGKSGFNEKYVVPGDWLDENQQWCIL